MHPATSATPTDGLIDPSPDPRRPSPGVPGAAAAGIDRGQSAFARLLTDRWVTCWMILLAGLAIGGKGFAYLGVPPLFITELTLLFGVGVAFLQPRWRELLNLPLVWVILALVGWSVIRTLPFIGQYGMDAPRDLVLVGYSAYTLILAAVLISQPWRMAQLVECYGRLAMWILAAMPVLWIVSQALEGHLPSWPWAEGVAVIELKPGDAPVHLGGVIVFMMLGLFRGRSILWTMALCLLLAITCAVSRAGLVAFMAAFMIGFAVRPLNKVAPRLALIGVIGLGAALLTDISIPVPGRDREFSAKQLLLNFYTIVGDSSAGDLDDTKTWRLDWWKEIINYTFYGDYFWTGKGFGVNLANDDGFQVWLESEALRSPHNSHLCVLARTGVPGFALWIVIQVVWLWQVVNGWWMAHQRKDENWGAIFVLLLAYYAALVLNASFDVYFEGPMGGVWYWSILGVGLAAAYIYPRHPQALPPLNPASRTPNPEP